MTVALRFAEAANARRLNDALPVTFAPLKPSRSPIPNTEYDGSFASGECCVAAKCNTQQV